MTPRAFHTLPALRRAVRRLSAAHQLPIETRARLVLSVLTLADHDIEAGRPVTLEVAQEPGADQPAEFLAVALRTSRVCDQLPTNGLPLPAQTAPDGATVWRVPLPAKHVPHNAITPAETSATEIDALEDELRAALAREDALTAEHHRLKHELAETNSGVLALYVQLEERDEQLRTAHGQMLRELEDALRPSPITVDGLEFAVHYAPAGTAAPTGGDLYDWFSLPDGTVHITVVDALGHGVRSTRSALNVTHAVRTLALEGHPLHSIVERTNEILAPFDPELMATVLLARLHPASGLLQLANGSHPPALLLREDGTSQYLEARGRGVGYPLPGSETVREEQLNEGDLLILYTDGLTESRRDPREGEARLVTSALRHMHRPIGDIPGAIADDMHTVILHSDDTLALAVRRRPPGPTVTPERLVAAVPHSRSCRPAPR
ncbi:PP2C family protein-serine/threonine phosphatase [Streptomyces sp. NPDC050315]|uniref:PP2C family protein-serine/threonine phosphatase n=1 Tax=Streptomyces sp. NPDC050315 TaxID=3155039 RepID=UPI0034486DEB